MVQNFYHKTSTHYPWFKKQFNINWIFDACIESLGMDMASNFFNTLKKDLEHEDLLILNDVHLSAVLNDYMKNLQTSYYIPLPLRNAIRRFEDWESMNRDATYRAREQTVLEVYNLYRLNRYSELIRYHLYRYTYFKRANKRTEKTFDGLLQSMFQSPKKPAIRQMMLSELQDAIQNKDDREVFSRMIFPGMPKKQRVDVVTLGESQQKLVLVQSQIEDKYGNMYTIREPTEPIEIGQLYQIFSKDNYPITISDKDRYFVVLDSQDRIIGGACYKLEEMDIALLEGAIVTPPLRKRGLGSSIIRDFCNRMASMGMKIVKTHYFLMDFCLRLGFVVDKNYGALVKFLTENENKAPEKNSFSRSSIKSK